VGSKRAESIFDQRTKPLTKEHLHFSAAVPFIILQAVECRAVPEKTKKELTLQEEEKEHSF